jgi:hypothetical protein
METGKRGWNGVLASRAYFQRDAAVDAEIRALADLLVHRVGWQWMLAGAQTICHGWRSGHGFLEWRWQGYDEALIPYLPALGSPSCPIGPEHYTAWTASDEWTTARGIDD